MSDKEIRIFPSSHTSALTTESLEKAKEYLHQIEFLAENIRLKTYPSLELIAGSSEGLTTCPSCGCKVKIEMDLWPYGNFFHSSYNSFGAEKEHQHTVSENAPFIKYDEQQIESLQKKLAVNTVAAIKIDMPCCHSSVSFDRLELGNICALARVD